MDQPSLEDLEPKGEQLQQFRKDLTSIARGHVDIPPQVDQAVLQKAMKALARTKRPRATVGRPLAWIAAAASLALLVSIGALLRSSNTAPQQTTLAATPSDLDHNGRVDILDAFHLARQLDADIVPTLGDINSDGRIDRTDVEAIAMKAVSLPQGAG